mmetsp:Transcript_49967/g.99498  ORF Transcript_49967/g.99498 Transcript_49967/m.99498 type:complete len:206 (+) Transcript_49967:293-910(+)
MRPAHQSALTHESSPLPPERLSSIFAAALQKSPPLGRSLGQHVGLSGSSQRRYAGKTALLLYSVPRGTRRDIEHALVRTDQLTLEQPVGDAFLEQLLEIGLVLHIQLLHQLLVGHLLLSRRERDDSQPPELICLDCGKWRQLALQRLVVLPASIGEELEQCEVLRLWCVGELLHLGRIEQPAKHVDITMLERALDDSRSSGAGGQ